MSIPEDDCVVCGRWPPAERWARRQITEWLPVGDDEMVGPSCIGCAEGVGHPFKTEIQLQPGDDRQAPMESRRKIGAPRGGAAPRPL
jgi:hypothetical protein